MDGEDRGSHRSRPAGLQQLAPPYCSVELCVGEGSSVLGSDVAQVANREIAGSVF